MAGLVIIPCLGNLKSGPINLNNPAAASSQQGPPPVMCTCSLFTLHGITGVQVHASERIGRGIDISGKELGVCRGPEKPSGCSLKGDFQHQPTGSHTTCLVPFESDPLHNGPRLMKIIQLGGPLVSNLLPQLGLGFSAQKVIPQVIEGRQTQLFRLTLVNPVPLC